MISLYEMSTVGSHVKDTCRQHWEREVTPEQRDSKGERIQNVLKLTMIVLAGLWSHYQMLLAVGAHTFDPLTQEAEAGGPLSSRPAWS